MLVRQLGALGTFSCECPSACSYPSSSCHISSLTDLVSWGPSLQSVQPMENFVTGPGRGTGDIFLIFGKDWRLEVTESVLDCPLVDLYS